MLQRGMFWILTGALALSLGGNSGTAFSEPPTVTPAPPNAPPPNPGHQQLTDENLPQMLKTAGFQVEEKTDDFSKKYWIAKTQRDGWGYVIEVAPYRSPQGQISGFWLKSPLGAPVNGGAVSPHALLNLLALNHVQAPFFFSYNKDRIHLNYEYPYGQINAQTLQSQTTLFMQKIFQTSTAWTNIHNTANK